MNVSVIFKDGIMRDYENVSRIDYIYQDVKRIKLFTDKGIRIAYLESIEFMEIHFNPKPLDV